ncbi:hypothetical protein [Methanohalophilus mahii]|nr:hypothetical protein [Methanohalophilus mahii]
MVTIALMSIWVGLSANEIADSQLRVEKLNHQPIFEFDEYKDSTKSFMWLSIYNNGYPVESIEICEPIVLFEIHYNDEDQFDKTKSFVLKGFYDVSKTVNLNNGELFRFGNTWNDHTYKNFNSTYKGEEGNFYKYMELVQNICEADEGNHVYSCSISTFIQIKYTDMYGDTYERLYSTNGVTLYKINDNNFKNTMNYI